MDCLTNSKNIKRVTLSGKNRRATTLNWRSFSQLFNPQRVYLTQRERKSCESDVTKTPVYIFLGEDEKVEDYLESSGRSGYISCLLRGYPKESR